ncbi:unnamed protein product [Acanthoscelides obtectus]|uniref:Tyrosine aminotransferase n=1 Tax=Acanthoscelides obtectus TaxID=200917 RepID=A0A9P0L1W5_ACAOB|nr:unnamed protein product [Acanthoscelides obtectus]CAK1645694.1 Tyrosine aminotransferase [Acanthoscelides obtectus]
MLEKKINASAEVTVLEDGKSENWTVQPSYAAQHCKNFIRDIVDNLNLQPNPEKPVIALSLGDPCVYGNLSPAPEVVQAVADVLVGGRSNGYFPSVGQECARQAVAEYLSVDGAQISPSDVILCSGCSSALEHAITVLACGKKGHNILIPRPGFPIYRTLAEAIGVGVRYYNLLPEQNWEVDLFHLESQIDHNTAALVINNPSNPCGSVWSEAHLRAVMSVARRRRIPVIADEIYERLVFPGESFISVAALEAGVPTLICGGLAKRFLVPGWRLGWIVVHDETSALHDIRSALVRLTQRTIGSCTLIQAALPAILQQTPITFHSNLAKTLQRHAQLAYECLKKAKGLTPYMPQGAMYMVVEVDMSGFPMFSGGLELAGRMMEEESVFCLPGEVRVPLV